MQTESTVTNRKYQRSLGLSVFNPDNSSDEDVTGHRTHPPKPLPVPAQASQSSYFPSQQTPIQQQAHNYPRQAFRQPSHPVHSASSSTSSISISTSSSSTAPYQFPSIASRQGQAQSSPTSRYGNASPHTYVGGSSSSSRSSPAMDTTPPPSTPSSNLAPSTFGSGPADEKNLDGLGLSVADDNDYPAQPYTHSRSDPRNGLVSLRSHPWPFDKLLTSLISLSLLTPMLLEVVRNYRSSARVQRRPRRSSTKGGSPWTSSSSLPQQMRRTMSS